MEKVESAIDILATEFHKRNNPTTLKPSIIGKVVELSPIKVSISDGLIIIEEDVEMEISEWFRFRCNIDKTGMLSKTVPQKTDSAESVTETHSYSGSSCIMPNAISDLASAIIGIRDELLALKCHLKVGDYVSIASLDEIDKYVLLDKVVQGG
jgi:hypothetical protein